MVGESSEESTKRIRVVQRAFLELQHKKELLQKERRNEKSTVLEFLESCSRRMDDQISKEYGKNYIHSPWIFDCCDI
jgi:hypothetical protein